MKVIRNSIQSNPLKFMCSAVAFVLALVGLIVYAATGVIAGFTFEYSTALFVFAIVGLVANLFFSVKRLSTIEVLPAICYIISVFLFLAVNANYIAAVVRGIDVFAFAGTFIATIVLFTVAALVYFVSFAFKPRP